MNKKPEAPLRVYGFCWFLRDDYDEARAAMEDPEVLFDTYAEWLKAAKKIEAEVAAQGGKVIRIRFDLESFMFYCVAHNVPPVEQTRANWAAAELRRRYEESGRTNANPAREG